MYLEFSPSFFFVFLGSRSPSVLAEEASGVVDYLLQNYSATEEFFVLVGKMQFGSCVIADQVRFQGLWSWRDCDSIAVANAV